MNDTQFNAFDWPIRGWQGGHRAGTLQAQQGQGVVDGPAGHGRCLGVGVLAAFNGHRIAAAMTHELGGADPVGNAARGAANDAIGIGLEPAIDQSIGSGCQCQGGFGRFMAEGLKLAVVVAGAHEDEGLALGGEGMQVEQDIMLAEQRGQVIDDPVFRRFRIDRRPEVAIEVSIAFPLASGIGYGIADRYEGQDASSELALAAGEGRGDIPDGPGTADFIAVDGASDDQARTGMK